MMMFYRAPDKRPHRLSMSFSHRPPTRFPLLRWALPVAGALWLLMMVLLWWGYDASRDLAAGQAASTPVTLLQLAQWQGWALVAGLVSGLFAVAVLTGMRTPASTSALPSAAEIATTPDQQTDQDRALRILVAEDAPAAQIVLTQMVQAMGHKARCCDNGAQAVEAVREGLVDLVLMDIHMPVMDGLEATKAIRALERPQGSVAIVGLTADGLPETRARALSAGMDAFLSKPVNREALAEVLEWLPKPQA
jgi:CheY-like chemotaxis protein